MTSQMTDAYIFSLKLVLAWTQTIQLTVGYLDHLVLAKYCLLYCCIARYSTANQNPIKYLNQWKRAKSVSSCSCVDSNLQNCAIGLSLFLVILIFCELASSFYVILLSEFGTLIMWNVWHRGVIYKFLCMKYFLSLVNQ